MQCNGKPIIWKHLEDLYIKDIYKQGDRPQEASIFQTGWIWQHMCIIIIINHPIEIQFNCISMG